MEPQREQEFSELLQVHPSNPSKHRVTLDTGETSLPPPLVTTQAAPLGSTITTPRTPLIPTVGFTSTVRETIQPGIKDPVKGKSPVESSENLIEPAALLASVQEKSGGATRRSGRISPAPPPLQGEEPRAESNYSPKRKAANQRESLQNPSGAIREEGNKKRPRWEASKCTPKRDSS